jgi:hypothetical protein
MSDIQISIPVELTAAMIIRAGAIINETRALELATELHEIVAECVRLFRADKDGHTPDALQIADFTLACWRQALVSNAGQDDTSDCHEAEWISVELAEICDDDLFLRWMMIGDIVTGSDVANMMMEGGVQ